MSTPLTTDTNSQALIAQGQSLYDSADAVSGGDYSGLMAGVGGLISDLPAGAVQTAANDVLNIVGSAAKGMALGAAFGPYGAAVGAAIGAVVGIVEDIFSTPPPVPQGDTFRGLGDQYVFPANPDPAYQYGVTPMMNGRNPRCDSSSHFWQVAGDGAWSVLFGFSTTWVRPPGGTPQSQAAAWALLQWYVAADSVSQANARGDSGRSAALAQALAGAKLRAGTALGGDDIAARAFALLESWIGKCGKYSTLAPFSPSTPTALVQAYAKVVGGENQAWRGMSGAASGQDVTTVAKVFAACPLDYLYYPVLAKYDDSNNLVKLGSGDSPQTVALCADTIALGLGELAVLGAHDLVALHFVFGHEWLYQRGVKTDRINNPSLPTEHHPNFMRIAAIISRKVKAAMRVHKANRKAGENIVHGALAHPRGTSPAFWLLLAGLVGGGVLLAKGAKS